MIRREVFINEDELKFIIADKESDRFKYITDTEIKEDDAEKSLYITSILEEKKTGDFFLLQYKTSGFEIGFLEGVHHKQVFPKIITQTIYT